MKYVTHYEPATLVNEVNNIIEHAFRPLTNSNISNEKTSQWIPAIDIKEEINQFTILADVPGADKNDINISLEENVLTIKGHRISELKEDKNSYFRVERVKGHFYRCFTLPDTVDGSKISAKIQKGVLEIVIPKSEKAQPRIIKIHCSD